jgi:hypothetical protein
MRLVVASSYEREISVGLDAQVRKGVRHELCKRG